MPFELDPRMGLGDEATRSRCAYCRGQITANQFPVVWYAPAAGLRIWYHASCALQHVQGVVFDLETLVQKDATWTYSKVVREVPHTILGRLHALIQQFPRDMCYGCYKKRGECTCPPPPPHDEDCELCKEYEENW